VNSLIYGFIQTFVTGEVREVTTGDAIGNVPRIIVYIKVYYQGGNTILFLLCQSSIISHGPSFLSVIQF